MMKIGFHEVKYEVEILVVVGSDDVSKTDDILVAIEVLKEHDFSVGSLGVGDIVESIKYFFEGNDLFVFLVHGFPDDTVGTLS